MLRDGCSNALRISLNMSQDFWSVSDIISHMSCSSNQQNAIIEKSKLLRLRRLSDA